MTTIVSKDFEIQENLIVLFEDLQNNIHDLRNQIDDFKIISNNIIVLDQEENIFSLKQQYIFHQLDTITHISEVITDYRGLDGTFQDYKDMLNQIEEIMLNKAESEDYETASIIKKWYDKFIKAIYL